MSAAAHSLTLTWFDPSDNPLRGKLEEFRVTWNRGTRVGRGLYIDLPLSAFPEGKEGRRSHIIMDLEAGEDYYVQVTLCAATGSVSCLRALHQLHLVIGIH